MLALLHTEDDDLVELAVVPAELVLVGLLLLHVDALVDLVLVDLVELALDALAELVLVAKVEDLVVALLEVLVPVDFVRRFAALVLVELAVLAASGTAGISWCVLVVGGAVEVLDGVACVVEDVLVCAIAVSDVGEALVENTDDDGVACVAVDELILVARHLQATICARDQARRLATTSCGLVQPRAH